MDLDSRARYLRLAVAGPAEIAGVGNGNPMFLEPFVAAQRHLFHGRAMLILRTVRGQAGPVTVTAEAEGLGVHASGSKWLRRRNSRDPQLRELFLEELGLPEFRHRSAISLKTGGASSEAANRPVDFPW